MRLSRPMLRVLVETLCSPDSHFVVQNENNMRTVEALIDRDLMAPVPNRMFRFTLTKLGETYARWAKA